MPRVKTSDKFFHKFPKKSGEWKNKILIGVNRNYHGSDEPTLDDLVIYLRENKISLQSIKIDGILFISKII